MGAYYNEHDPKAAAWLRELIKAGMIAPGEVDERSIEDVRPVELAGFDQCHFFAGIGVWSYALRLAGWPDDRPVWTGSCPCQPFSAAGKRGGTADERHLWPAFQFLIEQRRPPVLFGEQVASKDGLAWLDTVLDDLEGTGYAVGAADLCAAGIGAPHIRQRLWFVGKRLADGFGSRLEGHVWNGDGGDQPGRLGPIEAGPAAPGGFAGRLADAERGTAERHRHEMGSAPGKMQGQAREQWLRHDARHGLAAGRPGPINGFWRTADWLHCRDGKWRPVEARPQPMADGSAESLGRVRPEAGQEIEEALNAASMENQIARSTLLRALQQALAAEARSVWQAGRLPRLHEAPFLLAYLRQLQAEGWCVEESRALPSEEAQARILRVLRDEQTLAGPSHRRELAEQLTGKSADVVHFLSSLLARHAQADWAHAYETYAEIGFPIGHGSPARVARLRGYGNAIVAQAAQAFIESVMEITDAKAI